MKKLYLILIALIAFGTSNILLCQNNVEDSFLTHMQKRDSILIADQLKYGFRLKNVSEKVTLYLPEFQNKYGDSLIVVRNWQIDTLKTYNKTKSENKSFDLEGSILLTSLEEGTYELSPITVFKVIKENNVTDTLIFNGKSFEVKAMPVDTTTFKLHDIKGQIRYPVTFTEITVILLSIVSLGLLSFLMYYLIRKLNKKSTYIAKEPAHITALRLLDTFRGDKYWVPEKQKIFYSGVTDALRGYIAGRYGIEAMEMTTVEIFDKLKEEDLKENLYKELKSLFERADYVKFAKYVADNNENAAVLPLAIRFVTLTYQDEINNESGEKL